MQVSSDILKRVESLEIRSRKSVSALLSGNFKSPFRGSGMQFKEFRPYEHGDDTRHIAWATSARANYPVLKVYEEERELNIIFAIDVSGSALFGETTKKKIDASAELTALMGLAAVKSGDRVGFLFFDEDVVEFIPPKRSQSQVLKGLTHLLSIPLMGRQSNFNPSLKYLQSVLKSQCLLIVLSDFFLPPFQEKLSALAMKHECLLMQLKSPLEQLERLEGIFEALDPETGEIFLLDSNSKATKNVIKQMVEHTNSTLKDIERKRIADCLRLSLEDDYIQKTIHFFHHRTLRTISC